MIRCFYETLKIFFKSIVFMRGIKKLKVFRSIFNAFKHTHDVAAIEAAFYIVASKSLGRMTDLFKKCCICKHEIIASWGDQANEKWSIIVSVENRKR